MATKTTVPEKRNPPDEKDLLPGTRIGNYEIVSLIGRGGMGAVYKAYDLGLDTFVAIKTMNASLATDQAYVQLFLSEAKSASLVKSVNVVTIHALGTYQDAPYLVMEYVEGEGLGAIIAKGALSVEKVAWIMQGVCRGVTAIHDAGLIHRDLKPANIIISPGFRREKAPKILDFGIAKKVGTTGTTRDGVVGTQLYLSPEQVRGEEVTTRSDIFALGVIIYECLTGKTPHDGKPLHQYVNDLVAGRYPLPRDNRSDLPPALDLVVARALNVDTSRRYASAQELGAALLPFAGPHTQALWTPYYSTHDLALREQLTGPVRQERDPSVPQRSPIRAPARPAVVSQVDLDAKPHPASRLEPTAQEQAADAGLAAIVVAPYSWSLPPPSETGGSEELVGGQPHGRRHAIGRAVILATALGVGIGAVVLAAIAILGPRHSRPATSGTPSVGVAVVEPPVARFAGQGSAAGKGAQEEEAAPASVDSPGSTPMAAGTEDAAEQPQRARSQAGARRRRPERDPAAARRLVDQAEAAFQRDRATEALRLAKKAVLLGGGVDARLVLAKIYLHLGMHEEARYQYTTVLRSAPDDHSATLGLRAAVERLAGNEGTVPTPPAATAPSATRPERPKYNADDVPLLDQ